MSNHVIVDSESNMRLVFFDKNDHSTFYETIKIQNWEKPEFEIRVKFTRIVYYLYEQESKLDFTYPLIDNPFSIFMILVLWKVTANWYHRKTG